METFSPIGKQPLLYSLVQENDIDSARRLLKRGCQVNEVWQGYSPLHIACRHGYTKMALLLLGFGADTNMMTTYRHESPLHIAIIEGNIELVKVLVANGALVDGDAGQSALQAACRYGGCEIIRYLIAEGIAVHKPLPNRQTALTLAAQFGHAGIIHLLLKAGGLVNEVDELGHCPLSMAIMYHHANVVKELTENGANINRYSNELQSCPLHLAVSNGDRKVTGLLLSRNCLVDVIQEEGKTPLYLASELGYVDILSDLLSHGADPNAMTFELENTALFAALDLSGVTLYVNANKPRDRLVRCLIQGGCDVDHENLGGQTPLQTALDKQLCHIALLLLHADCNLHSESWITAEMDVYIISKENDFPELYATFIHKLKNPMTLGRLCRVNLRDHLTAISWPYHSAVRSLPLPEALKDFLLFQELPAYQDYGQARNGLLQLSNTEEAVSLPETVFALDDLGSSNTHGADRQYFSVSVDELNQLSQQTNSSQADSPEEHPLAVPAVSLNMTPPDPPPLPDDSMALHFPKPQPRRRFDTRGLTDKEHQQQFYDAIASGSLEELKATIENVLDINDYNRPINENALHQAVLADMPDIVTFLLEAGADINFPSRDSKMTALHFAAQKNNVKMVKLLLSCGADLNAPMLQKSTPLRIACLSQSSDVIDFLLQQPGVDLDAAERHGRTPLITAVENGNLAIVKSLIDAGCDVSRFDSQRRNAIHYAVRRRYADILCLLAQAGGNVYLGELIRNIDLADKRGLTPLILATRADFLDMIQLLLECGADPDTFGHVGGGKAYTAVWEAVQCGHSRALRLLVDAGADVNLAEDERYGSPLFALFMCTHSRPDILHTLLEAGIDVNYRNRYGYSALHLAIDTLRHKLAVMLFSADYDVRDDVTWMRVYLDESRVSHESRELLEWALLQVNQPLSLKSQVRLFIRAYLQHLKPLYKSVETLPFPKQIIDFILYREPTISVESLEGYSSDDNLSSSD